MINALLSNEAVRDLVDRRSRRAKTIPGYTETFSCKDLERSMLIQWIEDGLSSESFDA